MTKAELVEAIKKIGTQEHPNFGKNLTKGDVEAVLTALGKIVSTELAFGGHVPLPGVGMLEVKTRGERWGRNPRTGERITIPACKVVRLRVAASLKNAVNQ